MLAQLRILLVVSLLTLAALLQVESAGATKAIEKEFGKKDTIVLPKYRSIPGQTAYECEVTSSGDVAIAGRFGVNAPGLPTSWTKTARLATTIVGTKTSRHGWVGAQLEKGSHMLATDFTDTGRLFYITVGRQGDSKTTSVVRLHQLLKNGKPNLRFGKRGVVSVQVNRRFSVANSMSGYFNVFATRDGGAIVATNLPGGLQLDRFSAHGNPANWGANGRTVVPIGISGGFKFDGSSPIGELEGGGLLIANSSGLIKLDAAGKPDLAFGDHAVWSPPTVEPPIPVGTKNSFGALILQWISVQSVSVKPSGEVVALFAVSTSGEVGASTNFYLAGISAAGATAWASPKVAEISDGGDGGFPDVESISLSTVNGNIVSRATSFYASPAYTSGLVSQWNHPSTALRAQTKLGGSRFIIDSFAASPHGDYMYVCGSIGATSKNAKPPQQRKRVAIRRIKLAQ